MKEGKKVNRKEGRMEGHATNRNRTLPVYNMGELTQFKVFFFLFCFHLFMLCLFILSNARCVTLNVKLQYSDIFFSL